MTALELISLVNQLLFIGLFAVVLRYALRTGSRASWNTALLFAAIASVVVLARVAALLGFDEHPLYPGIVIAGLALAPFAMVRLVADFSHSSRWVQGLSAIAFVGLSVLAIVSFGPFQRIVSLVAIAYFLSVGGYAAIAFAREASRARGVTRRRMTAVAVGAILFVLAIASLFLGVILPDLAPAIGIETQLAILGSIISFFLGFAPPAWIRRAWREPDLRHFLERSIHLAGVADERAAVAELSQSAAAAFGASGASIGLADPDRAVLRYPDDRGGWIEFPDDAFIAGRAFRDGRRIVVADAAAEDPQHAQMYRDAGARAVIAAPIATETRRLGVLSVFAERMSIFVDDDLWLVDLLADQSAVLLEARTLAEHATALRAREEAARMKEEFLSAAAHDLRTPLTVVLGQAELLERRRQRNPTAPADQQGLARIMREARRLSDLVTELLDAQRLEQGATVIDRRPENLLDVVEVVRDRYTEGGVGLHIDQPAIALVASIDRPRIEQVLDNLVENSLKYTPSGLPPQIDVSTVGDEVRISVVDHGIGIPETDRGRIFERFFRASNAQSITDTGLGLGLYICRRIVEEHQGRIWFEPTPDGGTTFSMTLPLLAVPGDVSAQPQPEEWDLRTHEAAADV